MTRGFVYILTNQCMPGMVKIGKTTRSVQARAAELFHTGVPTPFHVEHSVECPDCHALEAEMHGSFADRRVSSSREFFAVNAAEAIEHLDDLRRQQVEIWLDSFFPDHMMIRRDEFIDPSTISIISHHLQLPIEAVDCVLEHLRPADMAFSKEKYLQRQLLLSVGRKDGALQ